MCAINNQSLIGHVTCVVRLCGRFNKLHGRFNNLLPLSQNVHKVDDGLKWFYLPQSSHFSYEDNLNT